MKKLRAKLDDLLFKHEIDVSRLFATQLFTSIGLSIYWLAMSKYLSNEIKFGPAWLLILFNFFMGWAFWAHKSWPRAVERFFTFLGMFFSGIGIFILTRIFHTPP